MRVLFLLCEGKARSLPAGRLDRITAALGEAGECRREIVSSPADLAVRIVERAEHDDCVAIGGGDGTLGTAAGALKETRLPFAIIPLGTANDLARTLHIPLDPLAAAGLVRSGRREDIDIGEVNGCYFFNAASIGLGVDVAERLAALPKRFGPLSYLVALADIIRARRSFRAEITCDGNEVRLQSIQLTVGNGRRHGGGVTIHSEASVDDGTFDIYSLEPRPLWRMLPLFPALLRGTHHAWRSVTTLHGRAVRVRTPDKPKRVDLDGEIRTRTPAVFTMHRNAAIAIVPADTTGV